MDINQVLSSIEQVKNLNEHQVVYVGKPSVAFFKEYILVHDNDFYEPLNGRIDVDAFVEKVHSLSTTFVLVVNGELAGLIASYFYDLPSEKGFITLTHTKREFRGLHLSTILLQAVQDYARSICFKYIDLMVYKDNAPAFNLYKKYGFEVLEDNNGRCLMRWTA
ncbi:hypothetical protein HMPREF1212_01790 [Parabacteroides sp. HGS0025]|nr:hypothetical protein HMPREF1212_01790 [Parabacteroides sp. HGS0025]